MLSVFQNMLQIDSCNNAVSNYQFAIKTVLRFSFFVCRCPVLAFFLSPAFVLCGASLASHSCTANLYWAFSMFCFFNPANRLSCGHIFYHTPKEYRVYRKGLSLWIPAPKELLQVEPFGKNELINKAYDRIRDTFGVCKLLLDLILL